mmetsp:Transcript_45394/g.116173  ORF Transcript_45394/g.116173 Transcript_45394/m.116173 type:complete len:262 (+) Transcript_45394:1047-1832(+)
MAARYRTSARRASTSAWESTSRRPSAGAFQCSLSRCLVPVATDTADMSEPQVCMNAAITTLSRGGRLASRLQASSYIASRRSCTSATIRRSNGMRLISPATGSSPPTSKGQAADASPIFICRCSCSAMRRRASGPQHRRSIAHACFAEASRAVFMLGPWPVAVIPRTWQLDEKRWSCKVEAVGVHVYFGMNSPRWLCSTSRLTALLAGGTAPPAPGTAPPPSSRGCPQGSSASGHKQPSCCRACLAAPSFASALLSPTALG